MAVFLIILLVTVGLTVRAVTSTPHWIPAESDSAHESANEPGLIDTCTRTFILVLMSLIGLLALGVMYGNVLGSANATP